MGKILIGLLLAGAFGLNAQTASSSDVPKFTYSAAVSIRVIGDSSVKNELTSALAGELTLFDGIEITSGKYDYQLQIIVVWNKSSLSASAVITEPMRIFVGPRTLRLPDDPSLRAEVGSLVDEAKIFYNSALFTDSDLNLKAIARRIAAWMNTEVFIPRRDFERQLFRAQHGIH